MFHGQTEEELKSEIEDLREQIRSLNEDGDYTGDQIQEYNDMLDECYEPWVFCGMEFMPSTILRECDPIGWRCGMNDYFDSRLQDLEYELENLEYQYQGIFGDDSDDSDDD